MDKKNLLTYEGLQKLESELHNLKVVKRKEVAQKIKEAREQGDLSENAGTILFSKLIAFFNFSSKFLNCLTLKIWRFFI